MSPGFKFDEAKTRMAPLRRHSIQPLTKPLRITNYSTATALFLGSIHFTVSAAFFPAMNAWSEL